MPRPAPAKPQNIGALVRPLTPSPELAEIVGHEPLARTEIVKRVWDYIKAHGLQDPADRREIIADDKLRAVFGQDRVSMMRMMGLLSLHLKSL
jgi:chromatin remodeling complex protein RSC6